MQKGRPKQHAHNWVWEFKFEEFHAWGEYNKVYGSPGQKIWKCIRGGKVKHVLKKAIFITASGFIPEPLFRSD